MDTVEQLNGYYFKGMWNLTPGELAFWILVDETEKQFNAIDIFAFATIVGSFNIIHVPGKPKTATRGTSILSLGLRKMISYRLDSRWRSPTWKTLINGVGPERQVWVVLSEDGYRGLGLQSRYMM